MSNSPSSWEHVTSTRLSGVLVSSLHKVKIAQQGTGESILLGYRLKAVEQGLFVFPELQVAKEGTYYLRFTVFERRQR